MIFKIIVLIYYKSQIFYTFNFLNYFIINFENCWIVHIYEGKALREISINVNKLFAVLYAFIRFFFILNFVIVCLLPNIPFFIMMLLLYFCLYIKHVNKSITFVFKAFVYHFKSTISIFVIIYNLHDF